MTMEETSQRQPYRGHSATTITIKKEKPATRTTSLPAPTQNQLAFDPASSVAIEFITVTVLESDQTITDTIFITDATTATNFVTQTEIVTVTTTPSQILGSSSPLRTALPILGPGTGAPTPSSGLWQQQPQQKSAVSSSAKATIVGLSVLSALSTSLLLLVLLILFVRHWRSRRIHGGPRSTGPTADPFDDVHRYQPQDVEKGLEAQESSRQSVASRFSDASNQAVVPSIPSRTRSMVSTVYPAENASLPPPLPVRLPISSSDPSVSATIPSKTSPFPEQPFVSYFPRYRQSPLSNTQTPSQRRTMSVSSTSKQSRSSVGLGSDGYSSSMMATVDSVNSSRLSQSDGSISQPPLSPGSTDTIYLERA